MNLGILKKHSINVTHPEQPWLSLYSVGKALGDLAGVETYLGAEWFPHISFSC